MSILGQGTKCPGPTTPFRKPDTRLWNVQMNAACRHFPRPRSCEISRHELSFTSRVVFLIVIVPAPLSLNAFVFNEFSNQGYWRNSLA